MANILIAGCGDLGITLGRQLLAEGHRITGLKRSTPEAIPGFDFYQADLAQPTSLQGLSTDQDLVLVILSPDDGSEAGYRRTYVDALRHLLEKFAAANAHPPFIYVSSTSVYGQTQGEWVDEHSITQPASYRGSILLEAEQLLHENGADNTVLRFSGIYNRYSRYLLQQACSEPLIQISPPCYTNRIHREDCVGILKHLVQMKLDGKESARLYLGSDDDPAPRWDVISYLAALQSAPAPRPETLAADADQNKRCSNRLIKQAGYQFKYASYRDGFAPQ